MYWYCFIVEGSRKGSTAEVTPKRGSQTSKRSGGSRKGSASSIKPTPEGAPEGEQQAE